MSRTPTIEADVAAIVAGLLAGERRHIARTLTELERLSPRARALLTALEPHLGRALVVGITGPPGAGKSTLINALIATLRGQSRKVGVIAVDPSSPVSGGAILGDRVRMTSALDDDGVFVRSVSARGSLGGLSPAAVRMIDGLDAAGMSTIVLETVGTGQSEIDIAEVADVRVVVSAPGLGDDIQAMKAGLLEIADIMVVNKGDLPGAEATVQHLKASLSLRAASRSDVPVLKTAATTGAGLDGLVTAIGMIGQERLREAAIERRRRRMRHVLGRAAADLLAARVKSDASREITALVDRILTGETDLRAAAEQLLASRGQT